MRRSFGRSQKQNGIVRSGDLLLDTFKSAQTSYAFIENVKYNAKSSEEAALERLASIDTGNKIYLSPQDVPQTHLESLSKASMDSHIRKLQAKQIDEYGAAQLQTMTQEAQQNYRGQKVRVQKRDKKDKCILTCWRDPQSGQYYIGKQQSQVVRGVISDLSLADNFLIVKPHLRRKLLNQSIVYYVVHVIDPATLDPMVYLTIV